ncbi:hypothetical protein SDRG_06440 [Saprolegnia diclina VS20]|uniref:Major facilitator superfamily (MFS) profile domain-containing protein n=1 Tax=Saprolegnia diclina (strain VS20) TaxID=1156394 RepID=T0QQZ7_SAPDV|nr:hypothetical protein SDRG_06440 [Saprolegnia diclina VS20]EQC36335.1 hypothetical protein SDRG_06440 [Saprolegnia diclina VS20]|eukprot:XP_008610441.1 hypothetical protein SDRG_06440 [Saprolegnia diclina VS20]
MYWTITLSPKSCYEVDAERYVFFWPLTSNVLRFPRHTCLLFHRLHLFSAIFLVQFCSGSLYAFMALPDPINHYFGFPTSDARAVQLILVAGVLSILAQALLGPLFERQGPRWSMAIATLVLTLGLSASLLAVSLLSWILFYVAMLVVAMAFSAIMILSISVAMKWCPDARGSVAGFCLVGFGVGKQLWASLYNHVTNAAGMDLKYTFVLLLLTLVPTMAVATLLVRTPPPDFSVAGYDMHCIPSMKAPSVDLVQDEYLRIGMTLVNYNAVTRRSNSFVEGTDRRYHEQVKAMSLPQCIFSADFVCLLVALTANCIVGLFYNNMTAVATLRCPLQDIYSLSDDAVKTLRLHGLIVDLLGRLVPAILSDVGIRVFYANPAAVRKVCLTGLVLLQCIAIPAAYLESDKMTQFAHVEWLLYVLQFASNAGASLIVCLLTDMFGVYHVGTMYGLSSMTWAIGQGLLVVTTAKNVAALAFQVQLLWWLSLIGLVALLFVRTDSADRFYRGYRFTVCGKVVVQRPRKSWQPHRQGTWDLYTDVPDGIEVMRTSMPYLWPSLSLDGDDDDDSL